MSNDMTCPDCDGWLVIEADGRRVSHEELLHLPRAPRSIKRRMIHKVWCQSDENRVLTSEVSP